MATKPKKGRTDGNIEITLENVRLSFPALFRAEERENEDGGKSKKFKASFLISKKKQAELIEKIEDAIEQAKEAKWGDDAPRLKESKLCLRDGDEEDWDGYAGCMYVSASNSKRPTVVGRNKKPLVEEDGKPYAGCYVNAVVRIWAQDNKHGKRVNASLEAVQFYGEGEPFSGYTPVDVDKAFKDFGDDEDDEKPRRSSRRSRDDEDEDEKPRRSSRRSRDEDDEDEDEKPRRSSRRVRDDDDEDEKPRRSNRRSRDDDEDDDD